MSKKPDDVAGIKLFLAASSSNEVVEQDDFLEKFFGLAKKYDVPIAVHSEMQSCIEEWEKRIKIYPTCQYFEEKGI